MENVQFNQQDFGFQRDLNLDLMSIEDWEKTNPYTPPPAKPMSPPPAKVIPARLDRNQGKDTQVFNTECQRRGFTHEFRFEEVAKGCFDVTLFVEGNQIDKAGPYASHRDAKEAMCRLALGKLSAMGFKNLTDSSDADKKRKSSELSTTTPLAPDGIEDENWVHIINSYAQQHKMDYPDYEFTEDSPQSFRCTMGFADSPLQAFGLAYGPFPKKDTAKKAAAMEAVKWLRAERKLSQTDLMSSKKRVSSTRQSLPGAVSTNNPSPTAMDTSDSTTTPENPPSESAAQQVFELARALGFSQPKFDNVKNGGLFVDESATFMDKDVRYEPRLAGVHGQVRRVFGKKAAHEECCRLVLRVLKEIQQSRLGNAL